LYPEDFMRELGAIGGFGGGGEEGGRGKGKGGGYRFLCPPPLSDRLLKASYSI